MDSWRIYAKDYATCETSAPKLQFIVLIVESHITQGIETNDAGINKGSTERVVDKVGIRCIFINAAAERTINTRVRVIMPGLSRLERTEIDLILARGTVIASFARRLLDITASSIIEKQ